MRIEVTLCTFAELMTAWTTRDHDGTHRHGRGSRKGTDFAYSGAVDALRINDTVYDFEPNGVFPTPAP